MTDEFKEKNTGKDKIVGRPVRLNKVNLKVRPNKDYAELIFFSDLHYGHPNCEIEKAKAMLDYALQKKIYIILGGDQIEAGTKTSVADGVYKQTLNPQKQMEAVIDLLEPIAKAGLIIGLHDGNHEKRITNSTGINIAKVMARILKVPFLGYSCWSILSVNGTKYSLYSTHGTGGSRFKHTRLKKAMDLCGWISSDILAYSHLHTMSSEVHMRQHYDGHLKKIVTTKQYVVLTGSYLSWDNSYAQDYGFPISRVGSPKAKIFANEKQVYFSF